MARTTVPLSSVVITKMSKLPLLLLLAAVVSSSFDVSNAEFSPSNSLSNDDNRIFGGSEARDGQFPYMVSLRVRFDNFYYHLCGGAIVNNRFVLTTAHYIQFADPRVHRLVTGTSGSEREKVGIIYEIEKFIAHADFFAEFAPTNYTIRNNIGLIKTIRTIEFNSLVAPIALRQEFVLDGVGAVALAWGGSHVSLLL